MQTNMNRKSEKIGVGGKAGKGGWTALVAVAALAGCGQTSFFDVTVTAMNSVDISTINSCQVLVSGAASDTFSLDGAKCGHVMQFNIGTFEYGTTLESGTLNFHIDLLKGDLTKMAQGDGSGAVKVGGHQPIIVTVAPFP
jgi:hypothetical protein